MNDYRHPIEAALRATIIHSPSTFSWFGEMSPRLPPVVRKQLTPQTARDYLHYNLQTTLYRNFYCRGGAEPSDERTISYRVNDVSPFVENLSASNEGTGYWEAAWRVNALADRSVIVRKDDLLLWVRPDECLTDDVTGLAPGATVKVRFAKELRKLSPGFYLALSDEELTGTATRGLVRVYWNLDPAGAPILIREGTRSLNRAGIPFRLKVLDDPARYGRVDSGVLYIRKDDLARAEPAIARMHAAVADHLHERTPVFTRKLAPGVGIAEDPGEGASFGLHHCDLLAEGMIRGFEQRAKSIDQRLAAVDHCYAEKGISLDTPYLNPSSVDTLDLHLPPGTWSVPRPDTGITGGSEPDDAPCDTRRFESMAIAIGRRLVDEAIWSGPRCTWLGYASHASERATGEEDLAYHALGPELYEGVSGVALFLAELYGTTGAVEFRDTAIGAMNQALARASSIPVEERMGLYTGWPGIALAATHVALGCDVERLADEGMDLFRQLTGEPADGAAEFDLLGGQAGFVTAAVILHELNGDAGIIERAREVADRLIRDADKTGRGYSWRSPSFRRSRNLTGLSHGASGAATVLLELYDVTGDSRYRHAALEAFRYERSWFDPDQGNWPDFREDARLGRAQGRTPFFSTFWCHGAPGIALSRLRAYEILGDEECRVDALIALRTTRESVERWLENGAGNFSLCHGLGGNAATLACGSRILGEAWPEGTVIARRVGSFGIATQAGHETAWPCGIAGEPPGLMLGLTGIGMFYASLGTDRLPSGLLWHRGRLTCSANSSAR